MISGDNPSTPVKVFLMHIFQNRWAASLMILLVAMGLRFTHLRESIQGPLMRSGIPMADSRYYDKIARQVAGGDLLGKHVFFLSPL